MISLWYLTATIFNQDGNIGIVPQETVQHFMENVTDNGFIYGNSADGTDTFFVDEGTIFQFYWIGRSQEDKHKRLKIEFYASDDHAYILVYDNLNAYANPDGSYYGVHPCDAFEIDYDLYEVISN